MRTAANKKQDNMRMRIDKGLLMMQPLSKTTKMQREGRCPCWGQQGRKGARRRWRALCRWNLCILNPRPLTATYSGQFNLGVLSDHYYIQTNGIFKLSMELYFGSPYVPTPLIHSRSVMALQRGRWPRSPAHFPTIFNFSTIFILIPFSFLYHFHFNTIFILIPFSF